MYGVFEENYLKLSFVGFYKVRRITLAGDRRMMVYDDRKYKKIKIYDKCRNLKSEEDLNQIGSVSNGIFISQLYLWKVTNEVRHIVECCKGLSKPIADGNQGLLVVRILEAADRSMHMNRRLNYE